MGTALLNLVFVGVGGFFGSIGRYLLAGAIYQIFPNLYFPIGTAVVNILGCFDRFHNRAGRGAQFAQPGNAGFFADRFVRRIYDIFNIQLRDDRANTRWSIFNGPCQCVDTGHCWDISRLARL